MKDKEQSKAEEILREEIIFDKKFKFGDIVINHFASEDNPHRKGVFIKNTRKQRSNAIEITDMKGEFWYCHPDVDSRLQIIGNILPPSEEKKEIKPPIEGESGFKVELNEGFKIDFYEDKSLLRRRGVANLFCHPDDLEVLKQGFKLKIPRK